MRRLKILIVVTILIAAGNARGQTTQPTDRWTPLMNGRDLSGWYTFLKGEGRNKDARHIFQIEDGGVVHVYKDADDGAEMPSGYFCTKDEYGDCRIRFEYKWGTKRFGRRAKARRDAGCLYHVTGEDGTHGGVWPTSVECQVQENDVGDVYAVGTHVSSTVDPATQNEKAPTFKDPSEGGVEYATPLSEPNARIIRSPMNEHDGWNTVEVELRGDSAVHIVNGKVNMRLHHITRSDPDDPQKQIPLTKGRILFQAEGAEVMYRNIVIRALDEK